eukprot:TRINITY_DN62906_c0_g1_i1.p1 TRINITY_DN62906_c0_g1~~TRINITY_DN62906_c0_g1_i1.p1  ORF type:complete len:425 (+),score=88.71 TRINITY_DN62906_c0_g1_i1:184-1458(+)
MAVAVMSAEEPEDFAPPPVGLAQCFPVIQPLSDIKLGPKDVRPPHQVIAQLRRDEAEDRSWAHKREREQARLVRAGQIAIAERHRADQSERLADDAALRKRQQEAEVSRCAAERQRFGDSLLREASVRLHEAKLRLADAEREAEQRISEGTALLEMERAHTADVEALRLKERAATEAARKRADEGNTLSKERLSVRDEDVVAAQRHAEQRVDEAKRASEARICQAKCRSEAAVLELQERLKAITLRCSERAALEVSRTAVRDGVADVRKVVAVQRSDFEQDRMKFHTDRVHESWDDMIKRLAKREEKTRVTVDSQVKTIEDTLVSHAQEVSREAQRREERSCESLAQGLHVLGHHHSCQRQYNVAVDDKLSGVVRGRLHRDAPERTAPSLRSLTPPPETLALHAPAPGALLALGSFPAENVSET